MQLVWFRNDLRLADNPALHAATQAGEPVLLLYILDERAGAANRWWLHGSLSALNADVVARGGHLVLRRGAPVEIISALVKQHGITKVHAARSFEPFWRKADRALDAALKTLDCGFYRHLSTALFAPERITTKAGGPFGVYTPFANACFNTPVAVDFCPTPDEFTPLHATSEHLEDWSLLPTKPDWASGMRAEWTPGEAGAHARLEAFLAGPIKDYANARDFPAQAGTSKLAPHVHFGEISPRVVWHRALALGDGKGVGVFLKELLWREFSLNLLWQHQTLRTQPIREAFQDFPWQDQPNHLQAWQRGHTGIPIVDAGMRELWQTGWMHNRVRMICASYLVKHLLIPWQKGEAWFWDTLCEADEAANGASWQWVAGCGADAAPYFRIFNPVLQSQKFDPDGVYIKRFVPELAALPGAYIHAPWEAPKVCLAGLNYPSPVVYPADGRQVALAAYATLKARLV